jgi:hypothetical protein
LERPSPGGSVARDGMTKDRIIAEIRRTAAENGGVPWGQRRFQSEAGISVGMWRGKYWRTWTEALTEAGFSPNPKVEPFPRDELIVRLVKLTRKQGRFPTTADVALAKQADPTLPRPQTFRLLGDIHARTEIVRAYAAAHPAYRDVLDLLPPALEKTVEGSNSSDVDSGTDGAVYMLKLGKHYKIGKSFSVPRRHKEIAIELPEKPDVVHVITTDDPTGIEAYWHKRFAEKHTNGEWFALTRQDVQAFKRRRFM